MKEVIMKVPSFSADYPKAPIYVADLVRCKECKHNYNKTLNHGKMYPRCDFTDWKLSENDYCSRGEREGE